MLSLLILWMLNQKDDIAASLYSGISYMEIHKYSKASDKFATVIQGKDNLFLHQVKWYMAMCHVKLNNKEKALALLGELSQESSSFFMISNRELINLKYIKAVFSDEVVMVNNKSIKLSGNRKKMLVKKIWEKAGI